MTEKSDSTIDNAWIEEIFTPEKTDEFFDAIYGGAEEGVYTIVPVIKKLMPDMALLAFELRRRPGQCLKCSLTYGLPEVFRRHPLLNVAGLAREIAHKVGWNNYSWELGETEEHGDDLHSIPFIVKRA